MQLLTVLAAAILFSMNGVSQEMTTPSRKSVETPLQEKAFLSLEGYLEQVRTSSADARAAAEAVRAAELKLGEAEAPLSSEGYIEYRLLDDKKETNSGFAPSRTQNDSWKVGVRDQTTFGLNSNFYFTTNSILLSGISPLVPIQREYETVSAVVEFRQSLLRDAFGVATRADLAARKSASRIELLRQKMNYKNLILKAENTYWSLVSYNEIVKLQEENVDRARRLRDRMSQQARLRLYDDVDAMQAEASLQSRELELQSSLDERASLARQFNTMRGRDTGVVESLSELPAKDMLLSQEKNPTQRMSREDLRIAFEQAEVLSSQAQGSISRLYPQLDLLAAVATNGLDRSLGRAIEEVQDMRNPTWTIGVIFSLPLDYRLIGDIKRSYRAQKQAANEQRSFAQFNEERVWDDLIKQKREAQGRFQRALSLEKLQTELVRKERQRLMNGRTTTFQAITFEQNLALAQIARVRAQLVLMQIHNVVKTFEEQL